MSKGDVRMEIETAFEYTPSPGDRQPDITVTAADEGVAEHFSRTTWHCHSAAELCRFTCALTYFTDDAFRYWLPAFMLAELEDPDAAELSKTLIESRIENMPEVVLAVFTKPEKLAIVSFLEWCMAWHLEFYPFGALARLRRSLC